MCPNYWIVFKKSSRFQAQLLREDYRRLIMKKTNKKKTRQIKKTAHWDLLKSLGKKSKLLANGSRDPSKRNVNKRKALSLISYQVIQGSNSLSSMKKSRETKIKRKENIKKSSTKQSEIELLVNRKQRKQFRRWKNSNKLL